ncbi:MAG: hypothetical protein H0X18_05175 [Geodermatophilaceae bacterium]|nr:hypothetical protein [Geodermatophilaceae bacterium]
MIGLGIALAVVGACCFAAGVTLQHQGVALVRTGDALHPSSLLTLVRVPRWWTGVLSSSIGAVLHAVALGIAPLTVVQPVGVLALGMTAIINARLSGHRLTRRAVLAIAASTGGVVGFLLVASGNVVASAVPPSAGLRAAAPVALAVVGFALVASHTHGAARGLAMSAAAGVSYGFTSLLMRAVAQDFDTGGLGGVAIGSVAGMALAMALGGWFMQQAYAAGPPQLAVASVTVVDPIVAVLMGVVLLGEAAGVAWWVGAGEFIAGAVALGGVIALATSQVSRKAVVVRDVLPQDLSRLDGRAADSRTRTGHQLAYSGLPARG